ncbi:MAG: glycosyl transferase group 1 [Mucilaginibacter sp.]|nr:glycosyl transferase group 1 [Mucilaginibacter sp.]
MKNLVQNIAFISEHASPLADLGGVDTGGHNVYVEQLAKFLVCGNYKIDVYTRWENPALPQVVDWLPDIRVIHIKAGPISMLPKEELLPYMEEFKNNMLSYIDMEELNYDLIHANFFMSAMVAAEIKKAIGIPFVVTFHALGHIRRIHQGNNDKFPKQRLQIETDTAAMADAVIAECPQDQDDLVNYYGVNANKISIIPCGFSPDEFSPVEKAHARNWLKLPENEFILLQLGRMVPRKGVDNVIKALGKLKALGKKARLVIVGGEHDDPELMNCPEMKRLKNIAKKAGILDRIHFAGRKCRSQLKYYYSAADIFITTPWYEPFGITPLEAMACGTPVIGSNVGGIKYSITDGETGCLVPPNDHTALAAKIKELMNDQKQLRQMSINAIIRVNRYFTWSIVATKVNKLYQNILLAESAKLQSDIETKAA